MKSLNNISEKPPVLRPKTKKKRKIDRRALKKLGKEIRAILKREEKLKKEDLDEGIFSPGSIISH